MLSKIATLIMMTFLGAVAASKKVILVCLCKTRAILSRELFDRLLQRRSILPQSLLGKAVRYAINQWEHLTVYLTDGRIEIDNNLVEDAITLTPANWLRESSRSQRKQAA